MEVLLVELHHYRNHTALFSANCQAEMLHRGRKVSRRMRDICDSPRALLQTTYARSARMDKRPHEKTFQTWAERIGIHGQERAGTALQSTRPFKTFLS